MEKAIQWSVMAAFIVFTLWLAFRPVTISNYTSPHTAYGAILGTLPPEVGYISWRRRLAQSDALQRLADCESGGDEKAINSMDTDGLKAYGLFQYKETTWLAFQEEMGISGLDIMSGDHQLKVTEWAFAHGKQSHWGICL